MSRRAARSVTETRGEAFQRPHPHLFQSPALVLGPGGVHVREEALHRHCEGDVGAARCVLPRGALERLLGALDLLEDGFDIDLRIGGKLEPELRPAADGVVTDGFAQPRDERAQRVLR
jgi:hypothetical protein